MKWSHLAAMAIGLLIAAAFGWTGETQPSRLSSMTDGEALGSVVLVFGFFALTFYNVLRVVGQQRRKNYHYFSWDTPKEKE